MAELPFSKMQGVGNDFVVTDGRTRRDLSWSELAIRLCDRKFGVGADGLLVLDDSDVADFAMRMYNPDGSPDVCGNGLRCISRYAVERGVVSRDAMRIETLIDVRAAQINRGEAGDFESVTVEMGQPRFAALDIPANLENPDDRLTNYPLLLSNGEALIITALSTGSTHAVHFEDALPDDSTFFRISPQVEHHPIFPERTSLMWCQVETPNRTADANLGARRGRNMGMRHRRLRGGGRCDCAGIWGAGASHHCREQGR